MERAVLLTQAESAELLRLSERTLERWRVSGDGPMFVKLGRRVMYPRLPQAVGKAQWWSLALATFAHPLG
jgi:hypothetical protein